jgi:hypothetical protein
MSKQVPDEPYENFVGKKEAGSEPTLDNFIEIVEPPPQTPDWQKHWGGMPAFVQHPNEPHKKIYVSFRNEEDYQAFAKLIEQGLTEKTKSIWYPKLDRTENSLCRWIEEPDA